MPRSLSRRSALPFAVFVDTTASPSSCVPIRLYLSALSRCELRLIRWETLNSKFRKWQSDTWRTYLDDVLIFVRVAQLESISRVARLLGIASRR